MNDDLLKMRRAVQARRRSEEGVAASGLKDRFREGLGKRIIK